MVMVVMLLLLFLIRHDRTDLDSDLERERDLLLGRAIREPKLGRRLVIDRGRPGEKGSVRFLVRDRSGHEELNHVPHQSSDDDEGAVCVPAVVTLNLVMARKKHDGKKRREGNVSGGIIPLQSREGRKRVGEKKR